jgi:hypothetical protein
LDTLRFSHGNGSGCRGKASVVRHRVGGPHPWARRRRAGRVHACSQYPQVETTPRRMGGRHHATTNRQSSGDGSGRAAGPAEARPLHPASRSAGDDALPAPAAGEPDQRLQHLRRHALPRAQGSGRARRAHQHGRRMARDAVLHRRRARHARADRGRNPARRPSTPRSGRGLETRPLVTTTRPSSPRS